MVHHSFLPSQPALGTPSPKMRSVSMRQLSLLRGATRRPSLRGSDGLSVLRRQPGCGAAVGNAVSAFTTRASWRPTSGHVSLVAPGKTQTVISKAQPRRLLSASTTAKSDGDSEEETGSYSEADHEHAVISAFDLL